ncbi:MAG: hypothetical protein WCO52_01450 [bacterium]
MKKQARRTYEFVGWAGMAAILLGYFLISFSYLQPRGIPYQLLTGLGSLGLVLHSYIKRDYQPLVLNLIWLAIAVTVILIVIL